ncbi:hypothetical protein [Frankia sp. ArI3]|uniref:hypothetical protein n=1 Tax=Frankia sp. ArI3 TaxID=1858 RepID=UPI001C6FC7E6|nr:hypothetical protein [Frankia sp. ArI3]
MERSRVAPAPGGANWPMSPHGRGSISGADCTADSAAPATVTRTAPTRPGVPATAPTPTIGPATARASRVSTAIVVRKEPGRTSSAPCSATVPANPESTASTAMPASRTARERTSRVSSTPAAAMTSTSGRYPAASPPPARSRDAFATTSTTGISRPGMNTRMPRVIASVTAGLAAEATRSVSPSLPMTIAA